MMEECCKMQLHIYISSTQLTMHKDKYGIGY